MMKLIFGCGYLGSRVAARWREAGDEVMIVTRSQQRAEDFRQQGFGAIVANVTEPASLVQLPVASTVLFSVGYDRSEEAAKGPSIEEVYADGVRNVLHALPAETGRFLFISTTGVYGRGDGGWVDEETQPDPQREGGRASLAAEQRLAEHPLGEPGFVLRLAGLYGPGRIPFLDRLRAGEPIPAPQEGYLNLIHVEDAARVVLAADGMEQDELGLGPKVYCVSDGEPVLRGDYYREVARRIGASEPRFLAPDPSSPRAVRAAANRRICNHRLIRELNVQLAYPSYREGLAAILEGSAPSR